MNCKNCGVEIIEGNSFCIKCGEAVASELKPEDIDIGQVYQPKLAQPKDSQEKSKNITSDVFIAILGILFAAFMIIGIVFLVKSFDVKNNYYNSESYSLIENAYVGGDAYNYIINGTYFTGYAAMGSISVLCAVICLGTSFVIYTKKN